MATQVSLKTVLSADPTHDLRAQLDIHGVRGARALTASVIANACHRSHFGEFGLLGPTIPPIVPAGDEYRLNTFLGHVHVQPLDWKPWPTVTYGLRVQFVGLEILETNETYDEPYIVMAVVTLAPEFSAAGDEDKLVASKLIKVPGDDHPAGYVFADVQTVWNEGQLIGGTGIKVAVFAYEEDSGDPDEVAEAIEQYLKEKAQQGAQAIASAYDAGASATAIMNSPEFQWFVKIISLGLAGWVADDEVGYRSLEIPMSEIKKLTQLDDAAFAASLKTGPDGMKYNYDMTVSGDGKYRVYFRVSAVEIPGVPPPHLPNP